MLENLPYLLRIAYLSISMRLSPSDIYLRLKRRQSSPEPGAGLYIDVENLGQEDTEAILFTLKEHWPAGVPRLKKLVLYVQAQNEIVWDMWAMRKFPSVQTKAKGVQYPSRQTGKNVADIMLALDASTDFTTGKVTHVIVVSDDSDYFALFGKLRELHTAINPDPTSIPFTWVISNRNGRKSKTIQNLGNGIFHEVPALAGFSRPTTRATTRAIPKQRTAPRTTQKAVTGILHNHLKRMERFGSRQCMAVLKREFPEHEYTRLSSQEFGMVFHNKLLPELRKHGHINIVREKSPKTYKFDK